MIKSSIKPIGFYEIWSRDQPDLYLHTHQKMVSYLLMTVKQNKTRIITDEILRKVILNLYITCLLYTSDAADDMQCVDLGGRRIIKKQR